MIGAAVGAVLVALIWALGSAPTASTRVAASPLVGRPVPAISAETLDGPTFDIERLTGRWVLINVFAGGVRFAELDVLLAEAQNPSPDADGGR
ncbi:MAG: TlpA family protein disulfide reductase [Iamia sp.]